MNADYHDMCHLFVEMKGKFDEFEGWFKFE